MAAPIGGPGSSRRANQMRIFAFGSACGLNLRSTSGNWQTSSWVRSGRVSPIEVNASTKCPMHRRCAPVFTCTLLRPDSLPVCVTGVALIPRGGWCISGRVEPARWAGNRLPPPLRAFPSLKEKRAWAVSPRIFAARLLDDDESPNPAAALHLLDDGGALCDLHARPLGAHFPIFRDTKRLHGQLSDCKQRNDGEPLGSAPVVGGEPEWNERRGGWEAGTRTPIRRSRVCSLTIRRPPNEDNFIITKPPPSWRALG